MSNRPMNDDYEICVPSVDVCGFCADSECDGLGCIKNLDAEDERDLPAIDRLHSLLRAGAAFIAANEVLASAEGRPGRRSTH